MEQPRHNVAVGRVQQREALTIQAVAHALDILECCATEPLLGVSEIQERLATNKATVSRHLAFLEKRNYVARDPKSGKFSLGLRIVELSRRVDYGQGMLQMAIPLMDRLRDITGETIGLWVRKDNQKLCVASAESWHEVRRTLLVGSLKSLYPGAQDKVFLAAMDPEEAARIVGPLDRPPIPDSGRFPTIAAELAAIRAAGFAASREERVPGGVAVAAPVFGNHRTLEAVMVVTGTTTRLAKGEELTHLPPLLGATAELSARLGYSGKRENS